MARAALRQIAMGLLHKYGGMKGREIGHMMGLDYSTVSQGRKRLRESLKSEEVARTYGEDRGKVVKSKDLTPQGLAWHIFCCQKLVESGQIERESSSLEDRPENIRDSGQKPQG